MKKSKLWNDNISNAFLAKLYAALVIVVLTPLTKVAWDFARGADPKVVFRELPSWLIGHWWVVLLTTAVGLVVFGWFYDRWRQRNPVAWDFTGYPGLLGMGSYPNTVWSVRLFHAAGTNRSGRPITSIDGFVQVHHSGKKYPLLLNANGLLQATSELVSIAPKHRFEIAVFFERDKDYTSFHGHEIAEFMRRFAPFTFSVLVNGVLYTRSFKKDEIQASIDAIINSYNDQHDVRPQVSGMHFRQRPQ